MASYRLGAGLSAKLEDYDYNIKGRGEDFLQENLANNPNIIIDLPELELINANICLVFREYPTSRGFMDMLIITENAEIIIVETKLIKNPESIRTVVAQTIDYIKAFSSETMDDLLGKLSRKNIKKNTISEKIKNDERFHALLAKNIKTGNFRVLIMGDVIHPNILGMVESIQSAPHLAFTIYLVELNAAIYDDNNTVITPKIVVNTMEVERSVIKIEIDLKTKSTKIESEIPSKESKGSKPILTWEQFLDNLANKEQVDIMEDFRDKWISEIDDSNDSIRMGTVGFSAGLRYGDGKRVPIQFAYNNRVAIISEKHKEGYNLPENLYLEYKEALKQAPEVYDKYLMGNKVEIMYDAIDAETLKIILNASLALARKMKDN